MKEQQGKNTPPPIDYCKKCVIPTTRPVATNEYLHSRNHGHEYIGFDEDGICSACRFCEKKFDGTVDWGKREQELLELLDKHRSKDGTYDCVVPGSGGKDSVYASHILKSRYGMHPLTVTWAPHKYTDIGWRNFQNWAHYGGTDNFLFTPNGDIHRLLTRNAFLNLLHPFQPFVLGQKTFAIKLAAKFDIPLIFYGPSPGESGGNVSISQSKFILKGEEKKHELDNKSGFRLDYLQQDSRPSDIYIGGKSILDYTKDGLSIGDLSAYLPLDVNIVKKKKIEKYYLGYFLKWVPQDCYYYAVDQTRFRPNTERTEGTYTKYSSIDDKVDGFFYFTTYIKFGYGRATQDAAQEIRHDHITRDEAIALVKKYDGEFPQKYFAEFLDYVDLTEEQFWETIDSFRDSRLWEKRGKRWHLYSTIFN